MNRDGKIGIIVLIVICSGVGFVLLAAPTVKKDSLKSDRPTLFSSSGKPKKGSTRTFYDEDLSIEMVVPTGSTEASAPRKAEPKPSAPAEIVIEKKAVKLAPEQPASSPALDRKAALKELEDAMRNSNDRLDIPLENKPINADKTKIEESVNSSNKSTDKPLESKDLEDSYYTVKEGDTLSNIAKALYQDVNKHKLISDANNGLSAKDLKIGMKLFIPGTESQKKFVVINKPLEKSTMAEVNKTVIYKVKSGDTISSISRKFFGESFSMTEMKKANPGKDLSKLKIGESINIPGQGNKK